MHVLQRKGEKVCICGGKMINVVTADLSRSQGTINDQSESL